MVVIGAGRSGRQVVQCCKDAGLRVQAIDLLEETDATYGRAFVAGANRVAVLDTRSGDELQILEVGAIVIATGSTAGAANTCFLGLRKLGVELDGRAAIVVDEKGASTAPTIFATGGCAAAMLPANGEVIADAIRALLDSQPAPGLVR